VALFPTRIYGGGVDAQQGRQYDVAPRRAPIGFCYRLLASAPRSETGSTTKDTMTQSENQLALALVSLVSIVVIQ